MCIMMEYMHLSDGMYVCMCLYECTYVWMDVCVCTNIRTHVCMYEYMYVCVCFSFPTMLCALQTSVPVTTHIT